MKKKKNDAECRIVVQSMNQRIVRYYHNAVIVKGKRSHKLCLKYSLFVYVCARIDRTLYTQLTSTLIPLVIHVCIKVLGLV